MWMMGSSSDAGAKPYIINIVVEMDNLEINNLYRF